tara:strand:+ start:1590 stop:1772 length:183 start_codon:yes stop_codon:yes gene_type:complete
LELLWHYQKEDNPKLEAEKDELTTRQIRLAPAPAPNVGKQKCHIGFAQIVDTIKEGLLYP